MRRACLAPFRATIRGGALALVAACGSSGPRSAAADASVAPLPTAQECAFPDDGPVATDPAELVNAQEVQRALEAEFPPIEA